MARELGMKTDRNGRKNSFPVSVSIFLAEMRSGSEKTELKTDGDIRKYRNKQIRWRAGKLS
jgi:hypothetical protein